MAKKLGRKREWVRIKRKLYFKRFTPIWKPWLSPANIKARFSRSKKELEWFKTPESKEQVIIHCDEKWFYMGAPAAIWGEKTDPAEFRHSARVTKLQREKIMFLVVVSNVPGAAKIALICCEKDKKAERNSKYHKFVYRVDRAVDAKFTIEMLKEQVYPVVEEKIADPSLPAFKAPVWHQTDNARPHVAKTTMDFKNNYAKKGHILVHPNQQAPRCPESNVLDMTILSWMQQYTDSKEPRTLDDIRTAVYEAWAALPEEVILHGFDHLQDVHRGIVERKGGNRTTRGA